MRIRGEEAQRSSFVFNVSLASQFTAECEPPVRLVTCTTMLTRLRIRRWRPRLPCLRRRWTTRHTTLRTTRIDLEVSTDIGIIDMTESTATGLNEACLVEGNNFVASTAEFTPGWEIVPLRPDLCPKKLVI
jgi:hypothetical protein